MSASPTTAKLRRRLGWLAAGSLLALAALGPTAGGVSAATGTIWTTQAGCETPDVDQNTNSYMVYETVHIRGTGFDPATYSWDITGTGKGGVTIASGTYQVTSTDDFCLTAVLLLPAHEDGGPYQANFADKHDNFNVKGTAATPTAPPPTPTPTPGGASTTLPPTDSVTGNAAGADSLGLVLMLLAGILASVMVLTPARARRR